MRKALDQHKLKGILQNIWPVLKTARVTKNKARLKSCHRSEETKEGHNGKRILGWDLGTEKGHEVKSKKIYIKSAVNKNVLSAFVYS